VIPAIDLRGGRCVRLVQGRADAETVYADDPVAVARSFAEAGARRLHVVDLDGAFEGLPRNLDVVTAIVQAVDIPVQLGGGIRDMAAVDEVLRRGVQWVILGTAAAENPALVEEACRKHPGRILVGIDARDGKAAVRGWVEGTGRDAVELARERGRRGVQWVILGTAAAENPALVEEACRKHPGRILVGIDARDGKAAVRGWVEGTGLDAVELAREMGRRGVREIVFTDIARDGMLQGP